jgi:hypothetical protein
MLNRISFHKSAFHSLESRLESSEGSLYRIHLEVTGQCITSRLCILQDFVTYLRHTSPASLYATAMSPAAVQQCISSFKVLLGEDGTNRGKESPWPCV